MKVKLKSKYIFIFSLILCAIVICIINPFSKSENIIDLEVAELNNEDNKIKTKMEVTKEKNDYCIILPEYLDNKKVNAYYIYKLEDTSKEKDIEEYTKYNSLEKYKIDNKDDINIDIKVEFDTKETNSEKLYYSNIYTELEDKTKISAEGYMPFNAMLEVNVIEDTNNIKDIIKENNDKNVETKNIYDIKIISEGKKYEPNKFEEQIKITIDGIKEINKTNQILHINDENLVENIDNVKINDSNIEFTTNSFSIFAIIEADNESSNELLLKNEENNSETINLLATNENGPKFAGTGEDKDPYLITKYEDLVNLSNFVNLHKEDTDNGGYYNEKYYRLENSISLDKVENWTPIGTGGTEGEDKDCVFKGDFNGNGFAISNINISINFLNGKKDKYGLFGAIYSENADKKAKVYNLEITGMNIQVNLENQTNDLAIGCIAGHIGKNSEIKNCIVKKSSIINNTKAFTDEKLLSIGGIAGDTSQNPTTDSNSYKSIDNKYAYSIDNCFSDVDISVEDSGWKPHSGSRFYQYAIGGIVGRIRAQSKFPRNCVYEGTIKSTRAFVGPIYGNARYDVTKYPEHYDYAYLGISSSTNKSIEDLKESEQSLFYNYKVISENENLYEQNYKSDPKYTLVELDQKKGYVLGDTYMKRVQGVNRGRIISDLSYASSTLNELAINELANSDKTYNMFHYDSNLGTYTFGNTDTITANIVETNPYEYKLEIEEGYSTENLSYEWYINGVKQESTTDTIKIEPEIFDRSLYVYIYETINGTETNIGIANKVIDKEKLELKISRKNDNGTKKIYATLETKVNISLDDYNLQWYEKIGDKYEIIEGKESTLAEYVVSGENHKEYKIVATYKDESDKYKDYNIEKEYFYFNGVYVNQATQTINGKAYQVGTDTNSGATPSQAVKTLKRAYEVLDQSGNEDENIIIIIGKYKISLEEAKSTDVFNKNAMIVGKYENVEYGGTLITVTNMYLKANTKFKDIVFNGAGSHLFIYCQGNNLTMGTGIKMANYLIANGSIWGLSSDKYPRISIIRRIRKL